MRSSLLVSRREACSSPRRIVGRERHPDGQSSALRLSSVMYLNWRLRALYWCIEAVRITMSSTLVARATSADNCKRLNMWWHDGIEFLTAMNCSLLRLSKSMMRRTWCRALMMVAEKSWMLRFQPTMCDVSLLMAMVLSKSISVLTWRQEHLELRYSARATMVGVAIMPCFSYQSLMGRLRKEILIWDWSAKLRFMDFRRNAWWAVVNCRKLSYCFKTVARWRWYARIPSWSNSALICLQER